MWPPGQMAIWPLVLNFSEGNWSEHFCLARRAAGRRRKRGPSFPARTPTLPPSYTVLNASECRGERGAGPKDRGGPGRRERPES